MDDAALCFSVLDSEPEDSVRHIQLAASNGRFSATQELYRAPEDFARLADDLIRFPQGRNDQVIFANGEPIHSDHARLTVRIVDSYGHAVIEVVVSNAGQDHYRAESRFNIPCEVAAINRLGSELKRWISTPDHPMMWQPEPE